MPIPPVEFLMYYAGGLGLVVLVLFWRRPRRGMRLRLSGGRKSTDYKKMMLRGKIPLEVADQMRRAADSGERSVNVIFNFNGESWDAFEVLGLPAGSSLPTVEVAYRESLERVDESSRAFIEAAFAAIRDSKKSRAG